MKHYHIEALVIVAMVAIVWATLAETNHILINLPAQTGSFQLWSWTIMFEAPRSTLTNDLLVVPACLVLMLLAYVRPPHKKITWSLPLVCGTIFGLLYLLTWPMLGGLISMIIFLLVLAIPLVDTTNGFNPDEIRIWRSTGIISTAISMAIIWLTKGYIDGIAFAVLPCLLWLISLRIAMDRET